MNRLCCVLALLYICCSAMTCKKESEKNQPLPAETQTGAGTFGCRIDGTIWVPNGLSGFDMGIQPLSISYDKGTLGISTFKSVSKNASQSIGIYIEKPIQGRKYVFGKYNKDLNYATYYDSNINYHKYLTDSINTGYITITRFDTINKIISGTFNFYALDSVQSKRINVTEGRFDSYYAD